MNRSSLIALGLSAGVLALVYSQRRPPGAVEGGGVQGGIQGGAPINAPSTSLLRNVENAIASDVKDAEIAVLYDAYAAARRSEGGKPPPLGVLYSRAKKPFPGATEPAAQTTQPGGAVHRGLQRPSGPTTSARVNVAGGQALRSQRSLTRVGVETFGLAPTNAIVEVHQKGLDDQDVCFSAPGVPCEWWLISYDNATGYARAIGPRRVTELVPVAQMQAPDRTGPG